MTQYREANAFDLPVFVSLDKALFPYSPWTAGQYKEEFSSATRHFVVAVDEAQNIPLNLIELLTTFLPNSGERYIYIFGDAHQNTLRVKDNALEFPFQNDSIVLDINCRSSQEITAAASSIFNETARSNGLSGPKPILALTVSGEPLRVYAESGPSAPVAIAAKHLIETTG